MPKVDRLTRVNELIKRELASLIERASIAPSSSVLVSVTEVRCSVDLANAAVGISVFGGGAQARHAVRENLARARIDFQKELARVLKFKRTPVIAYHFDERIAAGDHVLELLEEIHDDSSGDK